MKDFSKCVSHLVITIAYQIRLLHEVSHVKILAVLDLLLKSRRDNKIIGLVKQHHHVAVSLALWVGCLPLNWSIGPCLQKRRSVSEASITTSELVVLDHGMEVCIPSSRVLRVIRLLGCICSCWCRGSSWRIGLSWRCRTCVCSLVLRVAC